MFAAADEIDDYLVALDSTYLTGPIAAVVNLLTASQAQLLRTL